MAKKMIYKPSDIGVAYTDAEIKELERKIIDIYFEAEIDVLKKMDDFTEKYKKKDLEFQKQLKEGKITQADYDDWKKGQVFVGKQWAAKKNEMITAANNANKIATSIINRSAYGVFGENSNFMAYTMEHTAGVNFGFNTYNTNAVINLVKDDPQLLPKWKIDQKKDYIWNQKNINMAITQGIIQGESLNQISKRVATGLSGKNKNLMDTFAKTAMTQAQNSGRLERMNEGKQLGIDVKKKWVATLDNRTRYTHRELDGQIVDTDEDFKTEGYTIAYPGDPEAHPSLVYNCRCAITSTFDKYPSKYNRYDNIDGVPVKGMSYNEWKKAKENGENIKPVPFKKSVKKKSEEVVNKLANVTKAEQFIEKTINPLTQIYEKDKVEYIPPKILDKPLSEEEIISKLAGGDRTKGSCASVGLCYAGQKGGIDVLDFRGGISQDITSTNVILNTIITDSFGDKVIRSTARSPLTAANKLLKEVEEGNEYYFAAGRHASIVRKKDGKLQYLELQSATNSGWTDFNGNAKYTLVSRFGCASSNTWSRYGIRRDEEAYMVNVKDMTNNDSMKSILGYLNTNEKDQKKGIHGTIK